MADITMCKGTNCPKKDECYRFTAKENPYRQSYFVEIPFNVYLGECKHFTSK